LGGCGGFGLVVYFWGWRGFLGGGGVFGSMVCVFCCVVCCFWGGLWGLVGLGCLWFLCWGGVFGWWWGVRWGPFGTLSCAPGRGRGTQTEEMGARAATLGVCGAGVDGTWGEAAVKDEIGASCESKTLPIGSLRPLPLKPYKHKKRRYGSGERTTPGCGGKEAADKILGLQKHDDGGLRETIGSSIWRCLRSWGGEGSVAVQREHATA